MQELQEKEKNTSNRCNDLLQRNWYSVQASQRNEKWLKSKLGYTIFNYIIEMSC